MDSQDYKDLLSMMNSVTIKGDMVDRFIELKGKLQKLLKECKK